MPVHNSQGPQDRPLVVGVTGRIGAGKTSAAEYLAEAHGFFYIRYSQVLSAWRAEDPDSKSRLQAVGWEVMGGGMQAELNARLIAQLPAQSKCAIDGLRHPIDFECLSKAFPSQFRLFFIDCADETRWQRLRSRYSHLEDFARADSHPVEQQIEALRTRAFTLIKNTSSLPDLYSNVDRALEKIPQGD